MSQERASGFPEKGTGKVRGTSGESPGNFRELAGNLWIAVKFHTESYDLPGPLQESFGPFGPEIPQKSEKRFPGPRGPRVKKG